MVKRRRSLPMPSAPDDRTVPNCHARKTRGAKRHGLKPILLATAKTRHERLSSRPSPSP
jgi:hypothetical protein